MLSVVPLASIVMTRRFSVPLEIVEVTRIRSAQVPVCRLVSIVPVLRIEPPRHGICGEVSSTRVVTFTLKVLLRLVVLILLDLRSYKILLRLFLALHTRDQIWVCTICSGSNTYGIQNILTQHNVYMPKLKSIQHLSMKKNKTTRFTQVWTKKSYFLLRECFH